MSTVTFQSGLLGAVDAVRAFFAQNNVDAVVEAGWKRRVRQDNQSANGAGRVVFTPSGSDDGDGGKLAQVRFPGPRNLRDPSATNPTKVVGSVRSLLEWERRVLVSVWAVDVDPQRREDEAAQIQAVEDLFEWTIRAVHSAPGAFASVVWGSTRWTPPLERAFGLELRFDLTFRHPMFDTPRMLVFPGGALARGTYLPRPAGNADGDT